MRDDETTTDAPADGWRDWLAENNRVTPADEAAFRIDFGRWLAGLPERKRQMAERLLQGHRTGARAGMVGAAVGEPAQVVYLQGSPEGVTNSAGRPQPSQAHRPA